MHTPYIFLSKTEKSITPYIFPSKTEKSIILKGKAILNYKQNWLLKRA